MLLKTRMNDCATACFLRLEIQLTLKQHRGLGPHSLLSGKSSYNFTVDPPCLWICIQRFSCGSFSTTVVTIEKVHI